MFSLIMQIFIVLFTFSESLTTKCLSLNDEMSLNDVLSPKMCVPKKTKGINFKAFDMITNKN